MADDMADQLRAAAVHRRGGAPSDSDGRNLARYLVGRHALQACSLVAEDALDDGGVLGRAGPEVPGRGVDGGVAEQGLDLGGVGAALAQARGESVPAAVRAKALDVGVGAGGEHDLGDAGAGQRAALPGPCGAGVAGSGGGPSFFGTVTVMSNGRSGEASMSAR